MVQETGTPDCGTLLIQDVSGLGTDVGSICANAGTGPVSLDPGQSAVIYFKLTNGTITSLDSGAETTVSIFAGKAGGPQSVTVQGISP